MQDDLPNANRLDLVELFGHTMACRPTWGLLCLDCGMTLQAIVAAQRATEALRNLADRLERGK